VSPSAEKISSRSHWESFWENKRAVEEVYSNAGRVALNLQSISSLKGKKVLEIGAGTGRDSFPLLDQGAIVYQLDYAENSLRILKRLAEEQKVHVGIVGGDTFALPFRDGTFDIVFHQGLLEHFRPQIAERLLLENIRVLKQGGLLLIDVPQRYHPYTLVKHLLIALNKWFAGWERSFSVGELSRLLERLELTVVYSYGDWMAPSFFYRAAREALKLTGIKLPLYPKILSPLSRLRKQLRQVLLKTPLPLYTGISIGVVGKK
jgi:SAM-dependent methyltransferase